MYLPRISIITATHNSAMYVAGAIQSVLKQDYPHLEYIVIDGGSSDGTQEIVESYRKHLAYFVSEKDRGISDAFNKGIRLATGEIIGIVSSDDALLPGTLHKVAESYLKNGRPDVIHGNVITLFPSTGARSVSRPDASLRSCLFGQPLKHGATFITKNAYERFGLYDTQYQCAMDYDLVLRFIVRGARFVYLDAELAMIRSGGVNTRERSRTRIESRDISVRHGCPVWRANVYLGWKVFKDAGKTVLDRGPLKPLATIYRKAVGKNLPLQS